jgi:hypothetical protein
MASFASLGWEKTILPQENISRGPSNGDFALLAPLAMVSILPPAFVNNVTI